MTIEINLLPWREERRARRSKRFFMMLGATALLGLGVGYAVSWHYQQSVEAQQQRIAHIRAESQQLDSVIREVRDLETVREKMLEQLQVFTELQAGRTQTGHVLGGLTRSLVDGVHYTELTRQGDVLSLTGLAESHWQVSNQLRALAASGAFNEPVLSEVEAEGDGERRRFRLSMRQQLPRQEAESSESTEEGS